VAPLFLWLGYLLCAHHTHFHYFNYCAYMPCTLANPAPTWAPCPPVHPSVHLCAPFILGFPTPTSHSVPQHTYFTVHGQGNSFFWARFQLVIPRGLQGLGPKGGIGVLGYPYLHTTHTSVVW